MDLNKYQRIHEFVRKQKSHIKNCEHCGKEKKIDCALIAGKNHEKNSNNYLCLCRKCHYKYDHPDGLKHTENTKLKISKTSKERIEKNGVNENFKFSRKGVSLTKEHKDKISKSIQGSNHHQSKLVDADVIFILNSKESPTKLAKQFGVTYRTIANIKSRKTWRHLN